MPTSLLSELRGENTGLGKQRMIYGGAQRKSTNRRHPHQHHASAPHTHHFNNPLRSPLETATHQRSIAQREVRNQKMAKSQNRRDQWNSVSTMVDHVFNVVSAPASTNNKNDTDGASNEQHSRSTPNYINPTSGSDASPSDLHHPITNDIDSNVSDRNLRNVYIPPKRMQQTLSSPLFGAIPANNDNDRNPTNRHGNNKKEHRTNRNRKTQFNDGRMYHTTARIDDSDDKKKHQLGMLRSQSDAALISSALQTRTTGSTTMNTLNNNKNGRSQANQGGGTHKHSNKKYAQGYGNWGAPYHQVTDDDNMSTNVFSSNNTTHDNARTTHPSANSSSFTELDQYFQLSLPLTNTRHIGKTRVHSSSSSSRSLASSASLRSIHSRGTTARKTRPSSSTSSCTLMFCILLVESVVSVMCLSAHLIVRV